MVQKIIYAVVVTYKRKNLLEQVLNGLLCQTYPLSKIIVVDNNSLDGTEDIVTKIQLDNVGSACEIDYHNTFSNLGGAGGFEFGFKTLWGVLRRLFGIGSTIFRGV